MNKVTLLTIPASPGMDVESADRVIAKANALLDELNKGNVKEAFIFWKEKNDAISYIWTENEEMLAYVAALANSGFAEVHTH